MGDVADTDFEALAERLYWALGGLMTKGEWKETDSGAKPWEEAFLSLRAGSAVFEKDAQPV